MNLQDFSDVCVIQVLLPHVAHGHFRMQILECGKYNFLRKTTKISTVFTFSESISNRKQIFCYI